MAWKNDASGKACLLKAVVQLRVTSTAQLNDRKSEESREGVPRGGIETKSDTKSKSQRALFSAIGSWRNRGQANPLNSTNQAD